MFAQNNVRNGMLYHEQIDSLIKGDWYLTQSDIIDGYNITSDTNRYTSQRSQNKKITFTSDSIYNHRDSTLRYYVRNQNFSYLIQYDSLMRENNLKLYSGRKRKLHEVESYEIVKCSINELIIKSYQFLNDGLDYTSMSIVYTYRKVGVTDLLNEISGGWYCCSNQRNSFLNETDSITYEFKRTSNDSVCMKSDNHIDLEFKRENYENMVNFQFHDEYSGVQGKLKYSIDTKNNLIYFMTKNETLVYNYKVLNNEKLILSLDMERTQKINTHNTR